MTDQGEGKGEGKIDDGWLEGKEALADELNSTRNDATRSCRIYFIWKSEINCDVMERDATNHDYRDKHM